MSQPNTIQTDISDFTDAHISFAKGERAHVVVGIGFLSGFKMFLDPISADAVRSRYREMEGEDIPSDYAIKIIGFDEIFETYDFDAIER